MALILTAASVFAEAPDPWAPGTSAEPWPLIEVLQRPGALDGDRKAWQRAFEHPEPLVRAAVAWAAGRTRPNGAAAFLGVTAFDPDQLVRDGSLWALLKLQDPTARPYLWRVLATRRELTRAGGSSTIRHLGEPPAGFATLFRLRGLPFVDGSVAWRREWLLLVRPDSVEPSPGEVYIPSGIQWIDWTTERSEWDASERVTIRADITTTPRRGEDTAPATLSLETQLVPLDEPDSGPRSWEERVRIPVRLRAVGTDDRNTLALRGGERALVDLQLSLTEIPPGAYALEPFETGHPLLIRVRRSSRHEAEVQRAAAAARTPDEIEAISRQRVVAQADRWRDELATQLQANGAMPLAHLHALARVKDPAAAALFVDAVVGPRRLQDAHGDITADHTIVRAFGPEALPQLERAAMGWKRALEDRDASSFPLSLLRSVRLATPALDAVRAELLRELAPRLTPPGSAARVSEMIAREAFAEALVAIAARHPQDAGRALAAITDRPSLVVQALAPFGSLASTYTGYPYAADLDGVDTMLEEAWTRLPSSAPADSRSAIAAEAERLSIALPGMEAAKPTDPDEAVRELKRVTSPPRSYRPPPLSAARTLRRVVASGLAERDGRVALAASRLARSLTEYAEAARLAQWAVRLSPSFPERLGPLLARAEASADAGDAVRARADLEEALPHLGASSGEGEVRTRLQALDKIPARLRVRTRSSRSTRVLGPMPVDGRRYFVGEHVVESWDFVRGGRRVLGIVPWEVRAVAPVGEDAVAVLATDGSVGLLRAGQPKLAWRASVAKARDQGETWSRLFGDSRRVLVRDGQGIVHTFDARSGKRLWSRPSHRSVPLALHGDDPVVLGIAGPDAVSGLRELTAVEVRTGRARWSRVLAAPLQAIRIAGGRVAWLLGDGTLAEVDLRTGHDLAQVALPQPRGAQPGSALAFVPASKQTVVALSDRIVLVAGGAIAWSRETTPGTGSWTPQDVEVGEDGVIWRVMLHAPSIAEAWTLSGERIATYRVSTGDRPSVSMVEGRTLALWLGETAVLLDRVPQ